jgi:hypothetical protein
MRANEAIAPFVKDRGFDWEFHIDETPFDLWSVQGYRPPPLPPVTKRSGLGKINRRHELTPDLFDYPGPYAAFDSYPYGVNGVCR